MRISRPQTFHTRQRSFGEALLDSSLPVPDGIIGPGGRPSERRFNVYRNNVVAGQVSTLADAYPATAKLVGEAFFRAMARDYVLTHPPVTPMMFDYGADFPAFIDGFPAARELVYLGDVARIERAWVEAYHSPEASPLGADQLRESLVGGGPRQLSFQLHPSARMLQSRFPAPSIWEMNTGSSPGRTVHVDDGPEDILVVRPDADVHVYRLQPAGATFFMALAKGLPLLDATEQAFACNGQFDLVAGMATLIDARMVIGTTLAQDIQPNRGLT